MVDIDQLYPKSPTDIPADLTRPSSSYRTRVILVLLCLFLFLLVYMGLTVGSAGLTVFCFSQLVADDPPPVASSKKDGKRAAPSYSPRPKKEGSPFWYVVAGIASALLFLFLVKGLFRISRGDQGLRIEVTEEEQPLLFAFIRKLCQETRAPFPHRIYLVPDVNAAVAYHQSVLSLILPTRKNLIIGLGLVNQLNLTEFKAVLAHEFGHFSQNSMKLGSYVYTANRVVVDVVYGRGKLDQFISTLCRTDVRIAVFAWVFSAILWTMRKGLEMLFRGINFANTALSRQMEYNADLVAVSVTGSDALVFALARTQFACDALGQGMADLMTAADHKRFTRDIYFHQTRAAEYLRLRLGNDKLGTVPALPEDPHQTVQVFKPEDIDVPLMWATHPSNFDREANAKARYCRGPIDTRSAWELFTAPDEVREAMTRVVYDATGKKPPEKLEAPEAVQEFIDAEHAETTYHPRYHGLYDERYLRPGKLEELCVPTATSEFDEAKRLAEAHAQLYGDDLKERMANLKTRHEELAKLQRVASGVVRLTGKDLEHRGKRLNLAQVPNLIKEIEGEIGQDYENMYSHDGLVFRVHFAMAIQLGEAERTELVERYRFHLAVQEMHSMMAAHFRHVDAIITSLSGKHELTQHEFQNALGAMRDAHAMLDDTLQRASSTPMPQLTNIAAGEPLQVHLRTEPLIRNLPASTQSLNGEWINTFMGQLRDAMGKAARILFKSMGGLLALQERIAYRWLERQESALQKAPENTGEGSGEKIAATE